MTWPGLAIGLLGLVDFYTESMCLIIAGIVACNKMVDMAYRYNGGGWVSWLRRLMYTPPFWGGFKAQFQFDSGEPTQ